MLGKVHNGGKEMSLRDQFAREAMNGILASGQIQVVFTEAHLRKVEYMHLSEQAYAIADAMLKEREKKEGEL